MAAGAPPTLLQTKTPQTRITATERTRPSRVAQVGRILVAIYFVLMALGVNALFTLRHPEWYEAIADIAAFPPYAWLFREVIRPLATPLTLLLIAFELTVALLVLGRGKAVKLGLLAAILFQLAVAPAVSVYGLVNLPLAALQALLLRANFERPAFDWVRERRGWGSGGVSRRWYRRP